MSDRDDDFMIPGYDDGDYLIIGGDDDDEYDGDDEYDDDGFELPLWGAMPALVILAVFLCVVAFSISYKYDRFVGGGGSRDGSRRRRSSTSRRLFFRKEKEETAESSSSSSSSNDNDNVEDKKDRGLSIRKYGDPINGQSSHNSVATGTSVISYENNDDGSSVASPRRSENGQELVASNSTLTVSPLSFSSTSSSSSSNHHNDHHHHHRAGASGLLLQLLTQPRCVLCSNAFIVGEDVAHSYDDTKCHHTFHRDCLTKYWNILHPENDGNCPVCKEQFISNMTTTIPPPEMTA